MKARSKKTIKYSKHRAVLSDVLPYETPLTYSNRHFYKFLKDNSIDITVSDKDHQNVIYNGENDEVLLLIMKTLLQIGESPLMKEVRFSSVESLQGAINTLIRLNTWTSFAFEIYSDNSVMLKILNRADFKKLMLDTSLRKELELFNKSRLKIHTSSTSKLPLITIFEKIVTHTYNSRISLNIETYTLVGQSNESVFTYLTDYYLVRENFIKIKDSRRLPFSYRISHKEDDFRELSIPHPKNQLDVISFYERYKELIIYYCNQSPYSIRKPNSIASSIFINDKLHSQKRGDKEDYIEESGKEYDSLKTFFTYKKYANIHKFYEDYKYHRAEKKYNLMYKFDISKCFDSIYTHSISWAVYDKNLIKDNLAESDLTFPGRFDALMQNSNFGETNGILIGPEFSRIFSEIILQSIDKDIEQKLRIDNNLYFKRDYEIYRYVDDYFIFYNNNSDKEHILNQYKIDLKQYKMAISESKSQNYTKPLITNLTIAKDKIIGLFESRIKFNITDRVTDNNEPAILKDLDFRCNSQNLITKFKIIIHESNVEYKDIMNFTLALLNNRFEQSIKKFNEYYTILIRSEFKHSNVPGSPPFTPSDIRTKLKQESAFCKYLMELLDFTFFIYAVNPRVNFTIKICHILSRLISLFNEEIRFLTGFSNSVKKTGRLYSSAKSKYLSSNKHLIFKKISDEIRLMLEKNKMKQYAQIESLYLLIALQQLGKEYRITQDLLLIYFHVKRDDDGILRFIYQPNYFVITVLLFYIRDAEQYSELVEAIKSCILQKFNDEFGAKNRNTECTMLFFDILVCPYLPVKFKKKVLTAFNIKTGLQDQFLNFNTRQKYWFTKWDKFSFIDEIEAKIANEPY